MKKNTTEYLVAMALDEEKRISEATGEPLKLYEINVLAETKEGRKRIVAVKRVETIEATSLAHAHDISKHFDMEGCKTRVFPKVDVNDGESLMNFGRYIVRQYENWERRNDYAVMNLLDRTEEQRENMVHDAVEGTLKQHHDNPTASTYELWCKGMGTVRGRQRVLERHWTDELDQNAVLTGRIEQPHENTDTYPELSRLVNNAVFNATLSHEQYTVLSLRYGINDDGTIGGGLSIKDIAEEMGVRDTTTRRTLYKALKSLVKWMIENDESNTLYHHGITLDDMDEIVKMFEKRIGKK